ncbi:MAG: four helix bundle protein [Candidatus Omnitrophica bacterium]|nr:four helix bundle protein [Candidatus Omnitrophota bacterium]HOX54038.1 four helix bundle protein [Candidatus Omnitrophota bacterium]
MEEKKNKVYNLRKRSYLYSADIIKFLRSIPKDYISQVMAQQLLRSATSVGANIIEAQVSASKKDFSNFYRHALKSANESKFWLELIRDSIEGPFENITELLNETTELSNILASSILTLKENRRRLLTFAFWFLLFSFYFLV